MNSRQSSSEQFMRYLKSVGGSEADVSGAAYVVSDDDTVESVVSRLRIEQQKDGGDTRDPSILHASAQVMISRRDESDPATMPELPRQVPTSWTSITAQAAAPGKASPRRT
jgi:hypothetical protein